MLRSLSVELTKTGVRVFSAIKQPLNLLIVNLKGETVMSYRTNALPAGWSLLPLQTNMLSRLSRSDLISSSFLFTSGVTAASYD
ncbi:MAG: hypothetical protein JW795_05845 [Chitinivibrionales bacterium]|nr:hypothetical protein [Chitinivibrionales bacterium]